jgi:hypothetical protein
MYKLPRPFTLMPGDVNTAIIPLTKGLVTFVDTSDAVGLCKHNWCTLLLDNTAYAIRVSRNDSGQKIYLYMHKVILSCEFPFEIHHIDRDGLNNKRNNLEKVTRGQNLSAKLPALNCSSKYKGVRRSKQKSGKVWEARFGSDSLGFYEYEEDAAWIYNEHVRKIHGHIAYQNPLN